MKKVSLYTDGACSGNPGPGGWGAVLVYNGREKRISGGERSTTNNRMELTAAIEGLSALTEPCEVHLVSDSKYLIDGMTKGWARSWKSKGWKKSDGKPALNPDLWEKLLCLSEVHKITYEWIKGHAGHEYNEICDRCRNLTRKKEHLRMYFLMRRLEVCISRKTGKNMKNGIWKAMPNP